MGKKKNTIKLDESHFYRRPNGNVTARNLTTSELSGVIFGCTHKTIKECFSGNVFGLPDGHFSYVSKIVPGLPLFLFNYSDRKLHGIFEAASKGRMYINPCGWTESKTESTPYGAQVRVRFRQQCQPLVEEMYKPIIEDNYFKENHFWNEIDSDQTNGLIKLFLSSTTIGSSSSSRVLQPALSSQHNLESKGSSWDDSRKQELVIPGRSYSSVVRKTSNSLPQTRAQTDDSNTGWDNACTGSGSAIDEESTKNDDQDRMNWMLDDEVTNFSAIENTATSIPQMKWSSLFKNDNKDVENVSYLEQEVSRVAAYPEKDSPHWGSSSEEDLWENHADELVNAKPSCELACSDVMTKVSDSIMQGGANNSLSSGDERKESEEWNTGASELNLLHVEESNVELSPSSFAPCLDGASDTSESSSKDDTTEIHGGCFCTGVKTEIHSEEIHGENFEVQRDNSEEADISELPSSGLESVVAKLMQQMEEIASQLKQVLKDNSLEQELVNSKKEVERLKNRCKMLESRPCHPIAYSEKTDFNALDKSRSNLTESIFVVGGFDGSSWLSTLDIYSLSDDVMQSLSPTTFQRSFSSAAKLNGELYILGGVDSSSNLWHDTVELYKPSNNQWVSCPSLNERRGHLAGASLKEKIFVLGGGNGADCFSSVEMFDPDMGKWVPVRSMLHKRFAPAAAEINGMIYAVGGYDGKEYIKLVEGLDPRAHSWTRAASMNTRRGCLSVVVLNGKLYAIGGHDGTSMVTSMEVLDPRFGSWTMVESMSDSRGYSGAVVCDQSIYIIGGVDDKSVFLDTVECYTEGRGWEMTDLKAVGRRSYLSAIVL